MAAKLKIEVKDIKDIKDDRRWQLEAKLYGQSIATVKAIKRLFDNEYHRAMLKERETREKWNDYVSNGQINDLVSTARDLFEVIESEVKGVIRFTPGTKVWDEGPYRFIDFEGKGKKGSPVSWHVEGSDELTRYLHYSSDVETEIWRRVWRGKEPISAGLKVFNTDLTSETLNKYFSKYFRDFNNRYNCMPFQVESAFNHIPELKMPLKVKGFSYPHKMSDIPIGMCICAR